jgi:fructose-specific phosphotransferase system IIC component
MRRDLISHRLSYGVVLLPAFLAGCNRAPSFDIDGSLFPAWLVCFVIGILLAVVTRWLLLRLKVVLVFPILVYPSLAALFTFLLWLLFFG